MKRAQHISKPVVSGAPAAVQIAPGYGFFILMDNRYNVGDIIEVDGFCGVVTNNGVRTTGLADTGGSVPYVDTNVPLGESC